MRQGRRGFGHFEGVSTIAVKIGEEVKRRQCRSG